jgi:hypothetical protein
LSENIDVVQRGIAAKGLTPFETGGSTPPPPAENDAPDVVRSRIDRPIDLGSDQANLEEATRQRRREWEEGLHGDNPPDMGTEEQPTIARQKAGIIERRIQADYEPARTAYTGLKEVTQALSDQHWLERPESQFAREKFGMTDEQQLSARESEDLRKQVAYTPEEWAHYQRTGELKAQKPFLANERTGIRQPIEDHERILFDATTRDVFRNAREAQREMKLGHEVEQVLTRQQMAEAEAQALALALQQQAPAAEAVQSEAAAAPAQAPQVEQPIDPVTLETGKLNAARVAYMNAAKLSAVEWDAQSKVAAAEQMLRQQFPFHGNQAAMQEAARNQPQLFQQYRQALGHVQPWAQQLTQQSNQARQNRLAQEAQASQYEQAVIRSRWHGYRAAEDAKAQARIPELRDAAKARVLRDQVRQTLNGVGLTDQELSSAWDGHSGFSLRDSRAQELVYKATLWDAAQQRVKTINANRAVPNVQTPGVARPRGADSEADIGRLQRALAGASGANAIRIARQLTQAKRAAGQL